LPIDQAIGGGLRLALRADGGAPTADLGLSRH
jgi:hypothetical protein